MSDEPQARKHLESKIKKVKKMRNQFATQQPVLEESLTSLRQRLAALYDNEKSKQSHNQDQR